MNDRPSPSEMINPAAMVTVELTGGPLDGELHAFPDRPIMVNHEINSYWPDLDLRGHPRRGDDGRYFYRWGGDPR